jgi:hypothetical protein
MSVTVRVTGIDVATTMSSTQHSAELTAERKRLQAADNLTPAEQNALELLTFINELLTSVRDLRIDSHTQAVAAQRAGEATYDAVIHCPANAGATFAYLRQLFERVDDLCTEGVLSVRPATDAERAQRRRICAVLEAELAPRELVS